MRGKTALQWLVGSTLLCAALGAAAQAADRAERSSSAVQAQPTPGTPITLFDRTRFGYDPLERARLSKQQLSESLADPEQRARIRAERVQYARNERPQLARVLRLDPSTEERLFDLLADQYLAMELQPMPTGVQQPPAEGQNMVAPLARDHTQRMREIGQLLGPEKLEDYVDYTLSAEQRRIVEQLNSALPSTAKLGFEQQDALVAVLYRYMQLEAEQFFPPERPRESALELAGLSPEEQQRRRAARNFAFNTAFALHTETLDRKLLELAAPLLTAQQSQVFAAQLQLRVDGLRPVQQRAGAALDEQLTARVAAPPAARPLTGTVRLELELDVNGSPLVKTLTSSGGAAVSFEAPEGLWVEARPYLMEQDTLMVELSFYEARLGRTDQRRPLGRSLMRGRQTQAGLPASYKSGLTAQILWGRLGYATQWTYRATHE